LERSGCGLYGYCPCSCLVGLKKKTVKILRLTFIIVTVRLSGQIAGHNLVYVQLLLSLYSSALVSHPTIQFCSRYWERR
jgi:hypothetical protein